MPGNRCKFQRRLDVLSRGAALVVAGVLIALSCRYVDAAEASVKTVAGGRLSPTGSDAGYTDGNSMQLSQFNTPSGCAADSSGHVYVADRNNGALRHLDLAANRCRTVLSGLQQPVAVIVDKANAAYVLCQADGSIRKLDHGTSSLVAQGLAGGSAMAFDLNHSAYVTASNGTVVLVNLVTGTISAPILNGLNQPTGVAVLDSGLLAVSESGLNRVSIWDPKTGALKLRIGTGAAGFADGFAAVAQFNQPQQLAKGPGGNLVLADRGNSRVRLIDPSGFVSTVYGVDPAAWEGPACTSCDPLILPGWLDGPAEFAEGREPVGVAVAPDGSVFTTEVYYHLVRQVTGVDLTGSGDFGGGPIVVAPPTIDVSTGYYPMGQSITVSNPNSSTFLPTTVFYTVDGSEPTTNSFRVEMTGNTGTIFWQEKSRDLSSLRLKAFLGSNSSDTVGGTPVSVSEIGVSQDIAAGIGSTAIIPVVVNLRTNEPLESVQFRIEITPESAGAPPLAEPMKALSISTNDFIPLYAGGDTKGVATFQAAPYSFDTTRGLAITYIGTNANLSLKNFGVPALIAARVPAGAHLGDRYRIDVVNPSGTADADQQRIALTPMASPSLVVTDARYLVGDSSTATWYNAAQFENSGNVRRGFGDGLLDNSDVNNAFAAATGVRVPFPNTDLFDALDAFPEDTTGTAGGDGAIRYLDWQVILLRSLGLDMARWERSWSDGGVRNTTGPSNSGAASSPGQMVSAPLPGAVWDRQAVLAAEPVEQVVPGVPFDVPVSVRVAPGSQLAGLVFRAVVDPDGAAPVLEQPVKFVPNPDKPAPSQNGAPNPNTALCGWPLVPSSSFEPPLRGSNLLGHLRVTIPITAHAGQSYTIRFANADGSPDLQTQYNFDTQSASIWVLTPAQRPSPMTSEEWKVHFFGTGSSDDAQDNADPDHDGIPNWAEYLAGTDPTSAQSSLHLEGARASGTAGHVTLRWLSAPGKLYQIEGASSLTDPTWTALASNLPGTGSVQQWTQPPGTGSAQFYRIRLQP